MEANSKKTLWSDDSGFIITLELILIATIIGIGSIVGLACLRDAINNKLADVADELEGSETAQARIVERAEESANNTCVIFSAPPQNER